jgi:hypothetical protein
MVGSKIDEKLKVYELFCKKESGMVDSATYITSPGNLAMVSRGRKVLYISTEHLRRAWPDY